MITYGGGNLMKAIYDRRTVKNVVTAASRQSLAVYFQKYHVENEWAHIDALNI